MKRQNVDEINTKVTMYYSEVDDTISRYGRNSGTTNSTTNPDSQTTIGGDKNDKYKRGKH